MLGFLKYIIQILFFLLPPCKRRVIFLLENALTLSYPLPRYFYKGEAGVDKIQK